VSVSNPKEQGASKLRTLVTLVAVVMLPVIPFLVIGELPGDEWLDKQEGRFGVGVVGAALLAADVFLPIPSTVVGTLLGAQLGFWEGSFWAWLGLVAGNLLGYVAGRAALRQVGMELPAWQTGLALFVSRPIPILAEAVAIAAGAGGVPLRTFAWASVAGNAIFAMALGGSGAALLSAHWVGAGLVLPMALPVLGYVLIRYLKSGKKEASTEL
jgi:uncharacterized membrane protein YdjX (TVP38/TMEM64 family)